MIKFNLKYFWHCILVAAILCFIIWNTSLNMTDKPISIHSDANSYMRMAYHIYHNHTVSSSKKITAKPNARREPGFPLYLSSMMMFSSKLANAELKTLTKPEGALFKFRNCQIPIIIGIALGAWILTYLITRKLILSYLAMVMAGFGNSLLVLSNEIKREHFMAFLLLIVAIFLFSAIQTKHKKYFVLLGFSLAALVLTNAIFQYFLYILILYLALLFRAGQFQKKQFWVCLSLMLVCYFVPVGGWMIRNYTHFDRFYISDRAGGVLVIRAEYNKMSTEDYWASFSWWMPDPYFQGKVGEKMNKERKHLMLHRSNPTGHYRMAKSQKNFIKQGETFSSAAQKDKTLQKRAMMEIMKHPFKHIAMTIPFAWRGMFVEQGYIAHAPFSILLRSTILVSLLYFVSFFYLFIMSFRRKQWPIFSISLLCMYLYGINVFFTHSLPRYNQPLIPVLAAMIPIAMYCWKNRWHFDTEQSTKLPNKS